MSLEIDLSLGVREYSRGLDGARFFYINGIRTNFRVIEFACKDGSDQLYVDSELVEKLQIIRNYFNRPVVINSGYRNEDWNRKVGGSPNSQHMKGKAADIYVSGKSPKEVAEFAKKIGFRGVGLYDTFVHVDTRDKPSYWVN